MRLDEDLIEELLDCESLNEMLDLLDEEYDLDKPLGNLTKKMIINSLPKLLTAAQIKPRNDG